MAGLDFSLFYAFECPVSGKRAALPRQNPKTGRRVEADFAASATGGKVRNSVIDSKDFAATATKVPFPCCNAADCRVRFCCRISENRDFNPAALGSKQSISQDCANDSFRTPNGGLGGQADEIAG